MDTAIVEPQTVPLSPALSPGRFGSTAASQARTPGLPGNSTLSLQLEEELQLVVTTMRSHLGAPDGWPAVAEGLYHLATGGSYLRARLALLSGIAFGASRTHRIAAAAASELVHNASLIHDDICDGDTHRRGRATVWHRTNIGVALCSGDLLLTAAFRVALESDTPEHRLTLVSLLTEHVSRIVAGQSIEVARPTEAQRVRFRDYREATLAKTSPLIALPLVAGGIGGQLSARHQTLLSRFANAAGLAYQIIDDLDDLETEAPFDSAASQHHPYHALAWHRSSAREHSRCAVRGSMRRALRHAAAALGRADSIRNQLPALLVLALGDVLGKLQQRLEVHQATLDGLPGNPHESVTP